MLAALAGDHAATLLWNTALLCAGTLAIGLPLGTALALLLARTELPGRRFFAVLLATLLFIPLYLQAAAWQAGFGLQGWHTLIFAAPEAPPLLAGFRGAIWVHGLAAVPWVALIVGAGLLLVEPDLEEEALLNAGAGRVLLQVTLRRAAPSLAVAALWVALWTAAEITVTDLFQVRTFAEVLYVQFSLGGPEAVQVGVWPTVLLGGVLVLLGLACAPDLAARSPASWRARPVFALGRQRWPLLAIVLLTVALLAGTPLLNLAYMGGESVERQGAELVRGWSLPKLVEMIVLARRDHWRSFAASLAISGLAATAAVLAGVALAWPARRGGRGAAPALVVSALCLAAPGPVLAMGVIAVMNEPGRMALNYLYDHSITAPVVVQLIKALPLTTLLAWLALRSVPQETLDCAAVDGAGPLRRLFSIALPQRWGALLVAWLVALAFSLGDLTATILVVPPGVMPLSVQIFNFIHYGVDDRLAGLCLAGVGMFAALAAAALWLTRRVSV